MSTFWTPDGEKPINDAAPAQEETADQAQQMAELQRQLAETPAAVVITNHCFGLFELAALHLSLPQPQLAEAQLAIDALGAISEGLAGRLGEAEPQLNEGLKQLRLAFVQISQAAAAGSDGDAESPTD